MQGVYEGSHMAQLCTYNELQPDFMIQRFGAAHNMGFVHMDQD